MDASMRRCEKIDRLDYRRSRDRSKKSWRKIIGYDLKNLEIMEDMTQDRRLWRFRIKVMDLR